MTNAIAIATAQTVADHTIRAGWEDGEPAYQMGMLLTDLMAFAAVHGISFDTELAHARETFADVYGPGDLAPLADPALPPPSDLPAAALEMAELLTDALSAHIYSLDDGETIPADCAYVESINRVRASCGLGPVDVDQDDAA